MVRTKLTTIAIVAVSLLAAPALASAAAHFGGIDNGGWFGSVTIAPDAGMQGGATAG